MKIISSKITPEVLFSLHKSIYSNYDHDIPDEIRDKWIKINMELFNKEHMYQGDFYEINLELRQKYYFKILRLNEK